MDISLDFTLKYRMNKLPSQNRKQQDTIMIRQMATSGTNAQLHALTHDLVERIKELNCLYGITRLVEQRALSIDEILQSVVELIPPAWQYPEVTCARISIKNKTYTTANFQKTDWQQSEPIIVETKTRGTLEVCYLEERPYCFEGPFLREERALIHGIAERLGHIIESKNAEVALRRLYARENRLYRKLQMEMLSRIDFTRQLIHELKTPLTALMATSQLLTEETRNSKLEKLAGYVWNGASILNNRIDELHDVIKGEIGKLKLELKPLNIKEALLSLVDEAMPLSKQHHVSLRLEIKDEPLPSVLADEQRVRQIMFNLINNAYKYASDGKSIVIKVNRYDSPDFIMIEVQDFGPGISKDKQRRIFKPGYQSSRMKDQPGGLGIGLPLCHMLVKLHGGRIWLESITGKGCRIFFTLPVLK